MDFELTEDQATIRDAVRDLAGKFDDQYWREHDRDHAFPFFHYLVCAVASGRPGEITAWVLSEDRGEFDREEIVPE